MNIYQLLEEIMEALADGRQEGESTAEYRDRKADELKSHFANKKKETETLQKAYEKQAKRAKKEYEKNPNIETVTKWADIQDKATNVALKSGDAQTKEFKVDKIKNKIDWRKYMNNSEALEIMEAIINEIAERTKIDAYKKRVQQHLETADSAKKTAEWYMQHGGYKSAIDALKKADASQQKEFKHRLRTMIHDDKFGQHAMDKANKELHDEWKAKKDSKTNEALEIIEAIIDFADNLFELDYEEKQNISPNKISRIKKDKDGEKVEVVSVADELFPYEGSEKQQFNQKVLAKINDMIEGKGSLEDLIQFVRAGAKAKKIANEAIQEAEPNKECEYRKAKWEEASKKFDELQAKNTDYAVEKPETKKAYDEERKAYADLDKARRDAKKIHGPYESCEELIEGILDKFKKENKDPVYNNPISKELRGKKAELDKRNDEFVKHVEIADKAKGYRKQVHQEMAADADRAASKANKEYRQAKGEVLDAFRKRGASNPQAHKMLSRMMGEGLEELLQTIEGLYNTNEAKNIFGKETDRGSLEDDISTTVTGKTLNQHIEGAVKKVVEPKKRVEEALNIAEEIINEVTRNFLGPKLEKGKEVRDEIDKETQEIIADPKKAEKEKDEAAKKLADYNCKVTNTTNKATNYIERKSKIDKKKKK